MDLTPLISPAVAAIIAIIGSYGTMKNANNEKFQSLIVQIAALSAQVTDLKEQVEKHNGVIERTFALESDMKTAFKRIDELKQRDDKLEERISR